jgi:mycothiol synthase
VKVIALSEAFIPAFKEYFNKYSHQQDESFPPGNDYKLTEYEPAYILLDNENNLAGAASLLMFKEYIEAKTARFRFFHCINKDYEHYKSLIEPTLNHANGLNDIYCFVEDKHAEIRDIWEKLGFKIKRYSFVLKRNTENITEPEFPNGYTLKSLNKGKDEQAWCDIINESFANMQGHVHLYPEKVEKWQKMPSHIEGGMKLLWHNDKPVGTIALIKENENGEEIIFIEGVGLLDKYQGKGLGKNLLRAGIKFGRDFGVSKVMLSVNAENENAVGLYLKEGFEKETVIVCYSLKVR